MGTQHKMHYEKIINFDFQIIIKAAKEEFWAQCTGYFAVSTQGINKGIVASDAGGKTDCYGVNRIIR